MLKLPFGGLKNRVLPNLDKQNGLRERLTKLRADHRSAETAAMAADDAMGERIAAAVSAGENAGTAAAKEVAAAADKHRVVAVLAEAIISTEADLATVAHEIEAERETAIRNAAAREAEKDVAAYIKAASEFGVALAACAVPLVAMVRAAGRLKGHNRQVFDARGFVRATVADALAALAPNLFGPVNAGQGAGVILVPALMRGRLDSNGEVHRIGISPTPKDARAFAEASLAPWLDRATSMRAGAAPLPAPPRPSAEPVFIALENERSVVVEKAFRFTNRHGQIELVERGNARVPDSVATAAVKKGLAHPHRSLKGDDVLMGFAYEQSEAHTSELKTDGRTAVDLGVDRQQEVAEDLERQRAVWRASQAAPDMAA